MRHLPTPISKADYTGGLKEHTLAVRLYAIDAPETAKFGNPGQPFAEELLQLRRLARVHERGVAGQLL